MTSIASSVVNGFLKLSGANRALVNADRARDRVEDRRVRPRPYGPAARTMRGVNVAVDRTLGWPVYTVTPASGIPIGAVVYAHGGAWVNEIAPQHWQLCAQLAVESNLTVIVPIYPLVPAGTSEQVIGAVVDLVLASTEANGPTSLAGDSAGGQIALCAAIRLRDDHGLTVPRTVLIAPALDLSFGNPEIDLVQPTDPWLGKAGSQVYIEHWRADLAVDDPRLSPLFADLTGLGPITMFSGTRDILNPDARLLAAKARVAGVEIDYHEGAGLVHVYPLLPTPEGRAARAIIADRLRARHG